MHLIGPQITHNTISLSFNLRKLPLRPQFDSRRFDRDGAISQGQRQNRDRVPFELGSGDRRPFLCQASGYS